MHYLYLLKRADNHQTYIGYRSDLKKRLKEHREKKPELIYYEAYKNERDARVREKRLKERGQTIRRLKERLKYSLL